MSLLESMRYGEIIPEIDKTEYFGFLSYKEAESWGHWLYDGWAKKYEQDNDDADIFKKNASVCLFRPIEFYCGYGYCDINHGLRKGSGCLSNDNIAIVTSLYRAILSAPRIDRNIIVYRHVQMDVLEWILTCNKERTAFEEKGFLSTSLLFDACINECGNDDCILKIYVPKGTPAVYVNAVCSRDEEEVLFLPNYRLAMIGYPKKVGTIKLIDVLLW